MTDTAPAASMKDARILEAVEMPDGYRCDWYYVDTPPSVMVVPLTADGNLVFVRQYRHNLKAHVLEFPAGTVNEGGARRPGQQVPERPPPGDHDPVVRRRRGTAVEAVPRSR